MEISAAKSTPPTAHPNVLQVFNQYLEPGGEEAWVNVLAREVGLPTCLFRSAEWRAPGAPPPWRQALLMLRNPASRARLRACHREAGAQAWLFHNVFPVGSASLYAEARRLGVPVIQYTHNFRPFSISGYLSGDEADDLRHWGRTYWREIRRGAWQNSRVKTAWYATVLALTRARGWFRAIKAWIAVSDFMRERFISAGVPSRDIFTLRHFWRPLPAPPEPQDDRACLFLGRLVKMKGVEVLLRAWEIIAAQTAGRGPRLFVAGDGELAPAVRAAAAANPLIIACGHVQGEAKAALLARCSAVVAPSLCLESLGLIAYEAYDFSKPMLAARAGGLAETVTHGETGFLHEPGDAAGLARQVLALDAAPEQRRAMGRAGRAWLLANANEQDWREKFAHVVEHAIRRAGSDNNVNPA